MSDHAVQSDHDSDGMGRQSTHSHQSVWMAHWKLSSYKPETHGHDPSSIHYQCRGNDGDIKQHRPDSLPGISESSKGFREVSESRTVNIMNDSLKPSSINFRKERLESQSFPMFNLSENRERRMSQKNVTSCAGVVSEMGTSSREFRPEGISANLEQQQLNYHESLLKKSLAISTSNQHDVGPSSKIVPFIYNKGKTLIHSFVCGQEEIHPSLNLSPGFGFHAQQSLKLEPLQSSTDSEGKENFGDAKTDAVCLKNESSADTDTMDMNVFEKGHLSAGAVSSPKNKIVKRGLISSTLQAAIASSREETGGGLPKTELPDINEELPALPAVASSVEDGETSSSRTRSLDVEHLLSHAELPTNSKSGAFPDGVEVSDPCSRWVKRLKPSASGSSPYGTKSSKMEEACSHEKVNRFFSKIMRGDVTSSEPTMSKRPGKEPTALDQTTVLLRNGESSPSESERKSPDISLANPWIQRLCHQRTASPMKKNREAVVVCEPQKLNVTLDEFQKKQFPSVAAMAMMGKALNSIRPCGFTKKGPYVVWQT